MIRLIEADIIICSIKGGLLMAAGDVIGYLKNVDMIYHL